MNKTAIKNFAIWARRKLISDITYKAGMLGITESGIAQPLPQSTRDLQFFDIGTRDYAEVSGIAIEQRNGLVKAIQAKEQGSDYKTVFRNVIEEVAYTWFNRLIAVRFMEVNDYLPSHIRVLSSENEGKLEPDFVTTPFDTGLDFSAYEKDLIYQLKDENKLDELFRFLFIKQCNALNEILPGLFEAILDYTELLLNISFTDKDGIVYHLTHDISEDEFDVEKEGQVEIIGWMYQYYNTEPKDEVFALLKKNIKITKERIPAATQLFTPDWIVRYMVENSLGRLWVEGHPNEQIKTNWKYYLEEAEQEPDVVEQLNKIREEYAKLNPTDIKVIDPCMGSGHILVYAFDVLMQIYKSQGYIEREAAKNILQNNLYGIDIDVRAYQLAYFAVMMKARQYNHRIFKEKITTNLIAIRNPADVSKSVLKRLGGLELVGLRLVEESQNAEEYGSILQPNVTIDELDRLEKKLEEIREEAEYGNLLERTEAKECLRLLKPLAKQARLLIQKYDAVVTNPPYMGSGKMGNKLLEYVKKEFADSKSDLSAVFIDRIRYMLKMNAYQAMITQQAWMFISSFEKLRKKITQNAIVCMIHLGANAFEEIDGEVVQTTSFVIRNINLLHYKGTYDRLVEPSSQQSKEELFITGENRLYICQDNFSRITGSPIIYNLSNKLYSTIKEPTVIKISESRCGMNTGDNDIFIRYWHEINFQLFNYTSHNLQEFHDTGCRYTVYNKGGEYRKWYGNFDYVIKFDENDYSILLKQGNHLPSRQFYFRECITWTDMSTHGVAFRYQPIGSVFDGCAATVYTEEKKDLFYLLGLLNSKYVSILASLVNPTLHFKLNDYAKIPYRRAIDSEDIITDLVIKSIEISRKDWNSFETSWDFKRHPLVIDIKHREENDDSQWADDRLSKCSSLSWIYQNWKSESENRFQQIKANEEELNRIFINIYGLQDELTPALTEKEVTIRKADLDRDIRSLISYAVGCMFGRYSLDVDGLAFAGGEWDATKYCSFIPDPDNCIPITDEEYFADDIVGRFVEFVRAAYGDEYLEENLDFIAKSLETKGNTSREIIRNYFLNDFYKDHLKTYQKRPIYWLFDSGKQNGFKALVYMHRWNSDTVGNLRIEYLHKMQMVYEHEIETCQELIDHGTGHDVAIATRRKEKLVKQLKECKDYDSLVAHVAFSKIDIDLDDGVKVNYRKVQTGADGKFCEILANSKDIMAKEK